MNASDYWALGPGTLLADRYEILERIGGGSKHTVYKVRDVRFAGRIVAVKEVFGVYADERARADAFRHFSSRVQTLARIEHPSIPTVYDYFALENRFYLLMRYVPGPNLADLPRRSGGAVGEATVRRWGIQICEALHRLHSQQPPIVYQTLEPENLVLDEQRDRIVLVDFGIEDATVADPDPLPPSAHMGYAAPEVFSKIQDPRSDLYSLGATMFYLLTGADPRDNPFLVFDFARHPTPAQLNPAISPEMNDLLVRLVARDPANRPASALDVLRELESEAPHAAPPRQSAPVAGPREPDLEPGASSVQSAPDSPPRRTKSCLSCRHPIDVEAPFCGYCGRGQRPAPEPEPTTAPPPILSSPRPEEAPPTGPADVLYAPDRTSAPSPDEPLDGAPSPEIVFCPLCHTDNHIDWAFCQECGSRMPRDPIPTGAFPLDPPPAIGVSLEPLDAQDASWESAPMVGFEPSATPTTTAEYPPAPAEEERRTQEPPASISMSSMPVTPSPKRARLEHIVEGETAGRVFDLRPPETFIGRTEGTITFPQDFYLSRRHARIVQRNGRFYLVDAGSRNGTFVKLRGEVEIHPGDSVLMGHQHFRFDIDEAG